MLVAVQTHIFSIANQKGGVGKTTTAINLSVGLARKGLKTLLIDLDPQGNATSALGLEKTPGKSLYQALHQEASIITTIIDTREPNLSLIPSEVDLAAIEVELGQKENYLIQLRTCLQPLRDSGQFAVIIIDCPPALGMLSMNSLAAADHLLIALQCEYLALEGLGQILKVVEQLQTAQVNPELKIGGIVMTMFDIRTNLCRQVVDEVKKHFGQWLMESVIPRSIRLGEAPSYGQSIFEYDPLSTGAIAYQKLTDEVIKRFKLKSVSKVTTK